MIPMRFAAIMLVACTHEPAPAPIPKDATEICEGCVGELSGIRVGVADIWDRPIDGAMRTSVMLALWDPKADAASRDVYVAAGSSVAIGNDTYRVVRIDNPRGHPGRVVIARASSTPP
jgi:hypothetical protein